MVNIPKMIPLETLAQEKLDNDFKIKTSALGKVAKDERPKTVVSKKLIEHELVGVSGTYENCAFSFKTDVCIGRDPELVNVVMPAETKGISRLHCKIYSKGDKVYLVDMDSSNGTYLMGKGKLKPNKEYELTAGVGFYLADETQMFCLTK